MVLGTYSSNIIRVAFTDDIKSGQWRMSDVSASQNWIAIDNRSYALIDGLSGYSFIALDYQGQYGLFYMKHDVIILPTISGTENAYAFIKAKEDEK